jgi:symplekin
MAYWIGRWAYYKRIIGMRTSELEIEDTMLRLYSDALLVTATLNGLGGLLRTRPSVANRILNAVINFNPFRLANSPMTPTNKMMMRSMEKTVVVFLQHTLKRYV